MPGNLCRAHAQTSSGREAERAYRGRTLDSVSLLWCCPTGPHFSPLEGDESILEFLLGIAYMALGIPVCRYVAAQTGQRPAERHGLLFILLWPIACTWRLMRLHPQPALRDEHESLFNHL